MPTCDWCGSRMDRYEIFTAVTGEFVYVCFEGCPPGRFQ